MADLGSGSYGSGEVESNNWALAIGVWAGLPGLSLVILIMILIRNRTCPPAIKVLPLQAAEADKAAGGAEPAPETRSRTAVEADEPPPEETATPPPVNRTRVEVFPSPEKTAPPPETAPPPPAEPSEPEAATAPPTPAYGEDGTPPPPPP